VWHVTCRPTSWQSWVVRQDFNILDENHCILCKRWGMTKMGSTNNCPCVTTMGFGIYLTSILCERLRFDSNILGLHGFWIHFERLRALLHVVHQTLKQTLLNWVTLLKRGVVPLYVPHVHSIWALEIVGLCSKLISYTTQGLHGNSQS